MKNANIVVYVIGIIVILFAIWALTSQSFRSPTTASTVPGQALQNSVFVSITDPPHVPSGTTALVITYNSIALHETGKSNSTGFVSINKTGSLNLMNLTNASETIAQIGVTANQSFDIVRFTITSASITIGNQTYNVTVPNGKLQVNLNQKLTANVSKSGVLLQLNPSVLQIYSANQTFFVMVPAAKAIVLNSSATQANSKVGQRASIDTFEKERLNTTPSISITSAKILTSGGSDIISVTVKNNGNQSVVLKHLFIRGFITANVLAATSSNNLLNLSSRTIIHANPQRSVMLRSIDGSLGGSIDINSSDISNISTKNLGINQTYIALKLGLFNRTVMVGNELVKINASNLASVEAKLGIDGSSSLSDIADKFNISASTYANGKIRIKGAEDSMNLSIMGDLHNYNASNVELKAKLLSAADFKNNFFNMLNFIVGTNGTLSLPYSDAGIKSEAEGSNGYNLSSGASVTLSFNGTMTLPGGIRSETEHAVANALNYSIQPIVNQTYTVTVVGEDGAYARTNVTAS